jgi:hypothetical protein
MARTSCGGVAFALVRDNKLVVGLGALTDLEPLSGVGVQCQSIGELGAAPITDELPVQVTISGATHRFAGGETAQLGEYRVRAINVVQHHVIPGIDESLVIVHTDNFPAVAASDQSPLLTGCDMVEWAADSE